MNDETHNRTQSNFVIVREHGLQVRDNYKTEITLNTRVRTSQQLQIEHQFISLP